jgi:fused signal recognition particle receptor
MALFSFLSKEKKEDLDKGLEKTREGFFSRIAKAVAGKSTVDESLLDDIENALIASDVGVDTTLKIIRKLEERVAKDKYLSASDLNRLLKEEIVDLFAGSLQVESEEVSIPVGKHPYVIMVVGVNGVGKTTTIGKLANQFKQQGKKVLLGAADTFRAAAVDQLIIWSQRADVVIIDTAGRLHNKVNLMNELEKIKRVMQKVVPDAPHEVLLVLDASTGQNAIEQAKQFTAVTQVTAIALTKLDGTAKGGVVIGIADQFKIPVKYIGVGEKIHQLQVFNKEAFVESLFEGK